MVGVGVLAFEYTDQGKQNTARASKASEENTTVGSSLVYSASAATLSSEQIAANSRSGCGKGAAGAMPRAGRRGQEWGSDVWNEPRAVKVMTLVARLVSQVMSQARIA